MLKKSLLILVNLLICFLIAMFVSEYTVSGEHVNNGVISIVFDDNYDNQISNAWSLMEDRGLVGTFYVLTSTVNTPGYLSFTDLQTLQAAGNEIASHGVSHTSFTFLEEPEIRYECSKSKTTLEAQGLTITNFAYPNGLTTSGIDSIVSKYFSSGRTAYLSPYLIDIPTSQFRLPGFSNEDSGNELALLKSMIDQVYNTQSWGIFLFHNILPGDHSSDYTTSQENFEDFLDYIMFKGLPTITVNQGLDIISLSVDTNAGVISPLGGTYTSGSEVVIEAFSPAAGVGERFVWEGWSGSGVGSYSGLDNPISVVLNNSIIETSSWNSQYNVFVNQNGVGSDYSGNIISINGVNYGDGHSFWADSGSLLSFSFSPELSVNQGKKYVWTSSNGLSSQQSGSIVISGSGSISANYKTQFYVEVISTNGSVEGSGWYNMNELFYATIDKSIINETEDIRYIFSKWTGDGSGSTLISDPILVNNSLSIIASWKKQYLFIFNQEGLPIEYDTTILINSENQNLPYSVWIDESDVIVFSYPDNIPSGFGTQYMLTSPSNQSFLISDSPKTITATYYIHYNTNLFIIITILAVFGSLAFIIILLRKRNMI